MLFSSFLQLAVTQKINGCPKKFVCPTQEAAALARAPV